MVNGQLAERFASKLADLRTSRGLQTPTLVFHGAPSQDPCAQQPGGRDARLKASRLGAMWAPLLLTAATACDLQAWLQSEPVDQGYHVACVRDAGLKAHLRTFWRGIWHANG